MIAKPNRLTLASLLLAIGASAFAATPAANDAKPAAAKVAQYGNSQHNPFGTVSIKRAPSPIETNLGGPGAVQRANDGSIVSIDFLGSTGGACTGTFISRRHVLTARHCLPTARSASAPFLNFVIRFNPATGVPNNITAPTTTVHPVRAYQHFDWDVAVLETDHDVPGAVARPLGGREWLVQQTLSIDAYGTTDDTTGAGILRGYDNFFVDTVTPNARVADFNVLPAYIVGPRAHPLSYSCPGDSGAAAYDPLLPGRPIFGVVSGGSGTNGCGTSYTVVAPVGTAKARDITHMMNYRTAVEQIYFAYLGRAADAGGLAYWSNLLRGVSAPTVVARSYGMAPLGGISINESYQTNATVKYVIDEIAGSPESKAFLGSGTSTAYVTKIYQNLFSYRAPDSGGIAFWAGLIDNGSISRVRAPLAILASALESPASTADAAFIWQKTAQFSATTP